MAVRGVCRTEKSTPFGLRVILILFSPDSLISRRDSLPSEVISGEQEPVIINIKKMKEHKRKFLGLIRFMILWLKNITLST
jgi:hypothetical protein